MSSIGALYLVATPIGNLEDITLRALRILREVPFIAAEDTRVVRKLLSHYQIRAPRIVSYTESTRRQRIPAILAALKEGDVALVAEAGMPGVSDPGRHLVEAAAAAGHRVVPVPGASALTAALAVSGLATRRFHYLGFLPRQAGRRRRLLREVASLSETLVLFESPHRLCDALADLLAVLGDRRVAVCQELTKLYEEVFRGTLSSALERFDAPRGEYTLVVEGAQKTKPKPEYRIGLDTYLRELKAQGLRAQEAVRLATERSGLPRREVYRRWLRLS